MYGTEPRIRIRPKRHGSVTLQAPSNRKIFCLTETTYLFFTYLLGNKWNLVERGIRKHFCLEPLKITTGSTILGSGSEDPDPVYNRQSLDLGQTRTNEADFNDL
jgi:hypothetical protein